MTEPKTLEELKAEMNAAYAAYEDAFYDSPYARLAYEAALVAHEAEAAFRKAFEAQQNSND